MERQASRLLDLAEGLPAPLLERRVLVPRQIGLEDSSRFHSWTMVVEHLTIAGDGIAAILSALTHGIAPAGTVRVEDLKPAGGIGAPQAVERYRAMLRRLRDTILDDGADWNTGLRHAHPWFGPLGPGAWACFAPFHQAIHLKQARRIRRLLLKEVP